MQVEMCFFSPLEFGLPCFMELTYTINTEREQRSRYNPWCLLTNRHMKKLERKHRSRLMDGRRILNSTIGEVSAEVGQKITTEMERK